MLFTLKLLAGNCSTIGVGIGFIVPSGACASVVISMTGRPCGVCPLTVANNTGVVGVLCTMLLAGVVTRVMLSSDVEGNMLAIFTSVVMGRVGFMSVVVMLL